MREMTKLKENVAWLISWF